MKNIFALTIAAFLAAPAFAQAPPSNSQKIADHIADTHITPAEKAALHDPVTLTTDPGAGPSLAGQVLNIPPAVVNETDPVYTADKTAIDAHIADNSIHITAAERAKWDKVSSAVWDAATGTLTIKHDDDSQTVAAVGVPNVLDAVAFDDVTDVFTFTFVDASTIDVNASDLFDATAYNAAEKDDDAKTITLTRLDTGTTILDLSSWFDTGWVDVTAEGQPLEAGKNYRLVGVNGVMPDHATATLPISVFNSNAIESGVSQTVAGTFVLLSGIPIETAVEIDPSTIATYIPTPAGWEVAQNIDFDFNRVADGLNGFELTPGRFYLIDNNTEGAVFTLSDRPVRGFVVALSPTSTEAITIEQGDTNAVAQIQRRNGAKVTSLTIDVGQRGQSFAFIGSPPLNEWSVIEPFAPPSQHFINPADGAFDLEAFWADNAIPAEHGLELTNISDREGVSIELPSASRLLDYKVGSRSFATSPNAPSFQLRPHEVATVSYTETDVLVSIAGGRDRGYFSARTGLTALPSNGLTTGDFADVGSGERWLWVLSSTEVASNSVLVPDDNPPNGRWVSSITSSNILDYVSVGFRSAGTNAVSSASLTFVDIDGNNYPPESWEYSGTLSPWTGSGDAAATFTGQPFNGGIGLGRNREGILQFHYVGNSPNGLSDILAGGANGGGVDGAVRVQFAGTNQGVDFTSVGAVTSVPWTTLAAMDEVTINPDDLDAWDAAEVYVSPVTGTLRKYFNGADTLIFGRTSADTAADGGTEPDPAKWKDVTALDPNELTVIDADAEGGNAFALFGEPALYEVIGAADLTIAYPSDGGMNQSLWSLVTNKGTGAVTIEGVTLATGEGAWVQADGGVDGPMVTPLGGGGGGGVTERSLVVTSPTATPPITILEEQAARYFVNVTPGSRLALGAVTDADIALISPIDGLITAQATGPNPTVTFTEEAVSVPQVATFQQSGSTWSTPAVEGWEFRMNGGGSRQIEIRNASGKKRFYRVESVWRESTGGGDALSNNGSSKTRALDDGESTTLAATDLSFNNGGGAASGDIEYGSVTVYEFDDLDRMIFAPIHQLSVSAGVGNSYINNDWRVEVQPTN